MADIQQAAKWMEDGERVRNPSLAPEISIAQRLGDHRFQWIKVLENGKLARDARPAIFDTADFLRDDWEIAP